MSVVSVQISRRALQFLSRAQRRLQRYLDNRVGLVKHNELSLGRAYDAGWEGYECMFVLSTGRTGTQTLASMLGCSPFVLAEHEPTPRLVMASYEAFMDEEPGWLERWSAFVLAARDDHVLTARRAGKVYVETNNRMSMLAPALRAAFPASRFLFIHRDPYKVVVSSMRRGAYQGADMAWNFARLRPRSDDPYAAQWEELSPVEKEAWRWARVNADALAFVGGLPEERRFVMPASDLFREDQAVYERLFAFVGVPCPPLDELRPVLGRRMNAQAHFNGSAYTLTDEDRAKIRPIIAGVAEQLGYEA